MSTDELFLLARAVAVVTFGLSAAAKLRDLDGFHHTITTFRLASDRQARLLAPAVLAVELLLVLLLAVGRTAAIGLVGTTVLLLAYTAILANARAHSATIGCNCFGQTASKLSWYDVARNVGLLAVSISGLVAAARGAGTPPAADAALLTAAGAGITALLINLEVVVETLRRPISLEELS